MINLNVLLEESSQNLFDAFSFSDVEKEKALETCERMPDEIIDVHVHCLLSSHITDIDIRAYRHILSSFPFFSLEMSRLANQIFFLNKNVYSLRFGMVFRGVDYRMMNRYLVENVPLSDKVALFGVAEDEEYTIQELQTSKYAALKMYYLHNLPTATKICEVFTPKILKVVESMGIPIILHLPTMIAYSIDEIIELKQRYPELKATICHLGSSEQDLPGLAESFERFAKDTDFMMDTSMNHQIKSIRLALNTLGLNRIMFGSDAPINLLRSVPFLHPTKGERIVTEKLFHWADKDEHNEFCFLAKGAIHAHWQVVENLLNVIESDFSNSASIVKQQIFAFNAKKFYGFENKKEESKC